MRVCILMYLLCSLHFASAVGCVGDLRWSWLLSRCCWNRAAVGFSARF